MESLMVALPATKIVVLALTVLVLELVIVFLWHRRTGRGIALKDLIGSVFAGIFLLLALLVALTSKNWYLIVAALSTAFLAHLVDLKRRWKN